MILFNWIGDFFGGSNPNCFTIPPRPVFLTCKASYRQRTVFLDQLALEDQPIPGFSYNHTHIQYKWTVGHTQTTLCRPASPEKMSKIISPFFELIWHVGLPVSVLMKRTAQCSVVMLHVCWHVQQLLDSQRIRVVCSSVYSWPPNYSSHDFC